MMVFSRSVMNMLPIDTMEMKWGLCGAVVAVQNQFWLTEDTSSDEEESQDGWSWSLSCHRCCAIYALSS